MKVEDLKKAIEYNIEYNGYKDGEPFRFASMTMVSEFPPLYIAVDVSKDCYSLDFQNGYNSWTIGGCVEDYDKDLNALANKFYERLIKEGLIE
jgi:hypothetical protein